MASAAPWAPRAGHHHAVPHRGVVQDETEGCSASDFGAPHILVLPWAAANIAGCQVTSQVARTVDFRPGGGDRGRVVLFGGIRPTEPPLLDPIEALRHE